MKFLDTNSLQLVSFADRPSDYAVFSYAWTQLTDDFTNQDVSSDMDPLRGSARSRVARACMHAKDCNIPFLWAASACVDRSSSAEVAESVIASFSLVWDASLCIVYLRDMVPQATEASPGSDLENALSRCRWFTRAWTLQELVAAGHLHMFDRDWNLLGDKRPASRRPWLELLSRVSHVDVSVLANRDAIFDVSLGRRLSWAASRQASRPEDAAYALAGICGVGARLRPSYGEGRRRAFLRLQEKIIKTTSDLSILAWKRQLTTDETNDKQGQGRTTVSGIFADSVKDFAHFASKPAWSTPFMSDTEVSFVNRGLCLRGLLAFSNHAPDGFREVVLVLDASWQSRPDSEHVGVKLKETKPGLFVRASPWELVSLTLRRPGIKYGRVCVRCEVGETEAYRMYEADSRVEAWVDDVLKETDKLQAPSAVDLGQDPSQHDASTPTTSPTSARGEQHGGPTTSPREWQKPKRSADEMLETDPLENNAEAVLPELVALGLAAWNQERAAINAARADHEATVATRKPSRPTLNAFSLAIRPLKRARTGGSGSKSDNSCSAETDRDDTELLHFRRRRESILSSPLACPFYKLDPARWQRCLWEVDIANADDAVQHAILEHRRPPYCPICHTPFNTAAARNEHIVERSCHEPEPPVPLPAGVSDDQAERLQRPYRGGRKGDGRRAKRGSKATSRRKRGHLDEGDKWNRMWRVLFPDVPDPVSPYLSAAHEREVTDLRRFWAESGRWMVSEELGNRGLIRWEGSQEETALHESVFLGMVEELRGKENAPVPGTGL